MFLTRFEINTARRGARKLLGSPQAMHAAVLSSYPRAHPPHQVRVLWRVDLSGPHRWLYIAGPTEPDLTHLVEQAGWPATGGWTTRPYARLLDQLAPGQQWAFRLTANPTHSTRVGDSSRSQRLGHVTAQQQEDWFTTRAANLGIVLPDTATRPPITVRDRRTLRFTRHGATVTLNTATFDGQLVVADPDRLRQALLAGIGPAKAYGCGLMTLAPPRGAA